MKSLGFIAVAATVLAVLFASSRLEALWNIRENPGVLFPNPNYDYAPTVIEADGVQHFWWCAAGTTPSGPNGDNIYYRSYSFATHTWSSITKVLMPGAAGTWDSRHTCDPSVIEGSFRNPENGAYYSYIMYYTATDGYDGGYNRIGVAYSNDRVSWVKLSYPIIGPYQARYDEYGAGQASAINMDGTSEVWLFHTDTTAPGARIWLRTSTDGVTFTSRTYFTIGGGIFHSTSDFGYDPGTATFYAAVPSWGRARATDGDLVEASSIGIYSISETNLFDSTRSWTTLGVIDTNLTGYEENHNPGLLRDGNGHVSYWLPNIEAYFGAGTTAANTWNLTWAILDPTPHSHLLKLHYNSSLTDYLVTAADYTPSGYTYAGSLSAYVYQNAEPGTIPIYACDHINAPGGHDYLISKNPTCEYNSNTGSPYYLGILGWAYATRPSSISTRAIYRCYRASTVDHYLSTASTCNGDLVENGGNPYFYAPVQQQ